MLPDLLKRMNDSIEIRFLVWRVEKFNVERAINKALRRRVDFIGIIALGAGTIRARPRAAIPVATERSVDALVIQSFLHP